VRPLWKDIIRYISYNREAVIILSAVVVFSIIAGTVVYSLFEKTVVINDNGVTVTEKTVGYTVSEVLAQKGIELGPYDRLSLEQNSKLQKKTRNDIYIKRALPLNINVDGESMTIYSSKNTVYEALKDNINFGFYDRINGAKISDKVKSGMNLNVLRVENNLVLEKGQVPYSTIRRESSELASGEEKIVRKGSEGLVEKTFQILRHNGKEIARQLVKEAIVTSPVDKVVEFGAKNSHRTSRGGVIRYGKVLNMRATAYSLSFEDCGKYPDHPQFGITFTGVRVRPGIVAVDPRVIPLGSKLYVEIAGQTRDYGNALAADTGGAVKGNIIDLYFEDQAVVRAWGVKPAKVYILEK
jgi:uncharacterized protein YabE (DUF348 family)